MQDWQDIFFRSMQEKMLSMIGAAPPQPTAGPSIPLRNMEPNELRQLGPSGDREAPWAQPKSGSKRAEGCPRSRSPVGDRSVSSRDGRSCLRDYSPSSSSDRLSRPSKWLKATSHSPVLSSSHNDHWCSPGPQRHRAWPQSTASHHSHSPATRRWSRTCRPSPAGIFRRPARDVYLSPRSRSPSSPAWRSSRGCCTSPRTRQMSHNRRSHSFCSRSSTPRHGRRPRSGSRSPSSWSSTRDRQQHLYEADQCLLRLRDVSPVPQQEENLEADQNSSADDSRMSAEAVRKLFADLVCPPALSHYADPYPATDLINNQLVPYNKDTVKSKTAHASDEHMMVCSKTVNRLIVFLGIKIVRPGHLHITNWLTLCILRWQRINSR